MVHNPTQRTAPEDAELGGDPACWAHLLEGPPEPPGDAALAQLMADLADGVIICDPGGSIVFWNQAATRIFGWDASEVLGGPLEVIIPERLRKRHNDGYARVMQTGHTDYGDRLLEVPAVHRDGHTISIAFTVSLMTSKWSPRPTGIAAVIRDETSRRRELVDLKKQLGTPTNREG